MPWTAPHNDPDVCDATAAHTMDFHSHRPVTILLVEPEPGRAATRSLFLQAADYAVLPVKTSRELGALSATERISLVIIGEDFERANLSEVTQASRAKWPRARILVLGRTQRVLDDHLYDDSIEKPTTPKHLLDVLTRLLGDGWGERSSATPAAGESETMSRSSALHLVAPTGK